MDRCADTCPQIAYIGCWFNRDMYSHNCSDLVNALRHQGLNINVVTSNCRCFSSAQRFDIATDELINNNCATIRIPHAPSNPGKTTHGLFKYYVVKLTRLDIWLALVRGTLYYGKSRDAEIIHYDQVLEAFGCIPLFVLALLASMGGKRLIVTVHEIDPFQKKHLWINKLYEKCTRVIVYSENMKGAVVALGVKPSQIKVARYGSVIQELVQQDRSKYVFFGGHNILTGKGYSSLVQALKLLKERGLTIQLLIYVGHGCNGLTEAREMAVRADVNDCIEWAEFFSGLELATAYQSCKACILPYTGGSARHALTTAMANATPVIGTRCVDIPEYLGSLGIYIDGSPESIANAIYDIENGSTDIRSLGMELRHKATEEMDINQIGKNLCSIYAIERVDGRSVA
jgi:glycosyltransferase involved in cell wall biosynthesis